MSYSRGTELKLHEIENYTISIGTIDRNNPTSLYVKITAWGNPSSEDLKDYGVIVRKLGKRVKTYLYNHLDTKLFNHEKTMVDLDMRESGIRYGKSSFLNCEITLFQHKEYDIKSKTLLNSLRNTIGNITTTILNEDENFIFYKKKTHANQKLKA